MKLANGEETKLYYLRSRYEYGRHGDVKTFVRTGKFENGKLVGSMVYCCSKMYSLVFKSYDECNKFRRLYNCNDEICELELKDKYKDVKVELKGFEYKNCNCYEIQNDRTVNIFKNNC